MAKDRLRLGVVGVGHVGRHHARILSKLPAVELVAVVDIDSQRAFEVGKEFEARSDTDPMSLLGAVDAVTVAVPTVAHRKVVLVEKPIAVSLSEADEMVAVALESGAVLGVGHSERYNPAVTTALELVDEPRFVEVHRLASFPSRGVDVDVVFDVMIHDIDIILNVLKSEPVSIEAVGVPVLTSHFDIANARLRFADGCIVNLTASRISREKIRRLRFFQKNAYVSVDCAAQKVEAYRMAHPVRGAPSIEGGIVSVPEGEPLELELNDFVGAVRSGSNPVVDGAAGKRALELAENIVAAM